MKALVVYSSKTGNTKKVAEAIMEVLPEGSRIFPVEEPPPPESYDLVVLGFWVDKGNADKKMLEYMKKVRGKKVALLATLGAHPASPHGARVMERVRGLVEEENEYVGGFICQGKIAPELTERAKKHPPGHSHHMTPERIALHEEAARHPDGADLDNAKKSFAALLEKLR